MHVAQRRMLFHYIIYISFWNLALLGSQYLVLGSKLTKEVESDEKTGIEKGIVGLHFWLQLPSASQYYPSGFWRARAAGETWTLLAVQQQLSDRFAQLALSSALRREEIDLRQVPGLAGDISWPQRMSLKNFPDRWSYIQGQSISCQR